MLPSRVYRCRVLSPGARQDDACSHGQEGGHKGVLLPRLITGSERRGRDWVRCEREPKLCIHRALYPEPPMWERATVKRVPSAGLSRSEFAGLCARSFPVWVTPIWHCCIRR
jgi:hypothetical protein